jgi:hypothetical protein
LPQEKIRPADRNDYPGITDRGYRYLQQIAEHINRVAGFETRPDPAAVDWAVGDLTTDGAYHIISFAAIIRSGARAVFLRVAVEDNAAGNVFTLRRYGWSNEINVFRIVTQAADVTVNKYAILPVSRAGTAEYKATSTTWTTINITVCGWFY